MGDQYEYIQRSHITDLSERPITSLQSVLQVSGDPIPPFLLRLPRDRSPPIERLYGGGRGARHDGSGEEGSAYLFTRTSQPASPTHTPSSINMRISIILVAFVAAFIECSRLTPPVLPLLVRNPYLSIWLPNVRQNQPWAHWPMFWTGESIGFSVLASLPASSTLYPLLGRPQDSLPVNVYVSSPQQPLAAMLISC